MIRILYFGVLQETLGSEESVAWEGGDSDTLLAWLRTRGDVWAQALAPEKIFRVVVNQEIILNNATIPVGDEVGILPPVTGG